MPSYTNAVDLREISLAIEQVLIAPYGTTTWDPSSGKINVASVPAGFTNLGAVVEDTPQVTLARENYQLKTGIPSVLQYQNIMTLGGTFQFSLYSFSARKVQYALGNVPPLNVHADPTSIATVWPSSFNIDVVSNASVYAVGDWIITSEGDTSGSTTALATSGNEAVVSSITAGTTYTTLHCESYFFPTTPIVDEQVAKILSVVNPYGTSQQRQFHVLGVADFVDGYQVVHEFRKVQPTGEYTEQYKPDSAGMVPVQFEPYGYTTNRYPGLTDELIVAERFWFPA